MILVCHLFAHCLIGRRILSDAQLIGPFPVLSLRIHVDQGTMTTKGYFPYPWDSGLETRHQIV